MVQLSNFFLVINVKRTHFISSTKLLTNNNMKSLLLSSSRSLDISLLLCIYYSEFVTVTLNPERGRSYKRKWKPYRPLVYIILTFEFYINNPKTEMEKIYLCFLSKQNFYVIFCEFIEILTKNKKANFNLQF
jgi:hypothetical protein